MGDPFFCRTTEVFSKVAESILIILKIHESQEFDTLHNDFFFEQDTRILVITGQILN